MKKLIIGALISILIIVLVINFIYYFVNPSEETLIKRNCDIDILNGTVEDYYCKEDDELTRCHFFTIRIPGNHEQELYKQFESNGYNLNYYIYSEKAPWWPESDNIYYKYGNNMLFGVIRLNTCANTVIVDISESGDTYLYISCVEMGNLWVAAGIS